MNVVGFGLGWGRGDEDVRIRATVWNNNSQFKDLTPLACAQLTEGSPVIAESDLLVDVAWERKVKYN